MTPNKEQDIKLIVEKVLGLQEGISAQLDRSRVKDFVEKTINGGAYLANLVLPVNVGKEALIFIYILTDRKLAYISIDKKSNFKSHNSYLDKITNVNFSSYSKEKNGNDSEIKIEFSDNKFFYMKYSSSVSEIGEFFRSVDQAVSGQTTAC